MMIRESQRRILSQDSPLRRLDEQPAPRTLLKCSQPHGRIVVYGYEQIKTLNQNILGTRPLLYLPVKYSAKQCYTA